jgi:hypothetical protein
MFKKVKLTAILMRKPELFQVQKLESAPSLRQQHNYEPTSIC